MYCCEKCFFDQEIINIIQSKKRMGDCDFCKRSDVFTCDTQDQDLFELIEGLLNIYSPYRDEYGSNGDLLKYILARDWRIFNLDAETIQLFINSICEEQPIENSDILKFPVYIPEEYEDNYLENHAILFNANWEDFVNEIKFENRFHIQNKIKLDIFDKFLEYFIKEYPQGSTFYRARRNNGKKFPPEEMGAPPKGGNSVGRINPKGISVLYLANDIETTIHELKVQKYDYLSIGKFILIDKIIVVNFNNLDLVSPFIFNDVNSKIDLTEYAINRKYFQKISREIAKPLESKDNDLDYLPTQYLAEYIKVKGFDGVEYQSTINNRGFNLALFNQNKIQCTNVDLYKINNLSYEYDVIPS